MDSAERNRVINGRKEQLLSGLEAHIGALEELATTTNFDFDVATDIHPHLLENTPAGKAQLAKWQELYANLKEGPVSMVTVRWINDLASGCYGFGAPARYETKGVWLHAYENISQDDIKFIKGDEETPSRVVIEKPHEVLRWGKLASPSKNTVSSIDNTTLYTQENRNSSANFRIGSSNTILDEQYALNERFVYADSLRTIRVRSLWVESDKEALDSNAELAIDTFLINKAIEQHKGNRQQ